MTKTTIIINYNKTKMKKQLLMKTLLVAVCLGGANSAWADELPTPVYSQNFESATTEVGSAGSNFGITGDTLSGTTGAIVTGDAAFGKYYQNMSTADAITTRTNYLTIVDATTWSNLRTAAETSHAFTISFWINAKVQRAKSFDSYWGAMFTGYTSAGGTTAAGEWNAEEQAAHPFGPALCTAGQFRYCNGANITDNMDSYRDAVVTWRNDDNWHHFSFVFSNLNQQTFTITCYLDGVQKYSVNETASDTGIEILNNIDRFTIGGSTPHWNDPDNAYAYDEINIYSSALSADQVASIYNEKYYSYTVNAVDGSDNVLKEIASGNEFPGTTISYSYPRYINVNGTLYFKDKVSGNPNYAGSFSLTSDNKVEKVTYTASAYTNVVYFKEAEDVLTSNTSDNVKNRCSNQAGGYSGSATTITTLPAGTYTMYFAMYAANNRTFYVYKNSESEENKIKEQAGSGGWQEYNTGEFTLEEASTILVKGGDSGYAFDYFFITGTPAYTVLGDPYYSAWSGYTLNLSEKSTITKGQSYSYKFINHNHTTYGWDNFYLPVYYTDGESVLQNPLVVRADYYEDINGSTVADHQKGFSYTGGYNAVTDLADATIDMTVFYTDDYNFRMESVVTTSDGTKKFYNYNLADAYTSTLFSTPQPASIQTALGANWCWLEVIKEAGAIATTNALGYTTFSNINKLDLDNLPEGLKAYYALDNGVSDGYVTLTEATGVVPGETGLILKGEANTVYEIPTSISEATALSGNLLVACPYRETVTSDKNKYVLVNNSGTMEFQSLEEYGATIPTGKAYLNANSGAGARLSIVFEDEGATAIKDIDASNNSGAQAEGKYLEKGKIVILKNGVKFNTNGQKIK